MEFRFKLNKLQHLVKTFEKCENETNYYKLINFLKEKRDLIEIDEFKLILTGKNGVVIYNSERENIYSNYKYGLIPFAGVWGVCVGVHNVQS